jgi:hypothetical protein
MFFSLSPALLIHLYNKYELKLRMEEVFNPDVFVAKWYCSRVGPEDMPGFAADALEAGYDGPDLRRLAGLLKPTSRETDDLFQSALREIKQIKVRSLEQAVFFLSRITAADIVEGRVDPILGNGILAGYAMRIGYPEHLVKFFELDDLPIWGEYAPPRSQLIRDIMEQARKFLTNVPE